ncbi:MAG: T9SS type A sorting domain-containing protein [Bacteroidetes bacterium]|nr:T9SS type A sorting domain-containing protein [Bacteroidota bacterium]
MPIREDDDEINGFELTIADGTATLQEFEAQTLFEMKKALNEKLELYPDLKNGNTVLTDFYNTTEASTIGDLKEVKKTLTEKTAGEVTLETAIINEQITSDNKFHDAKAAMDAITNATVILQSDIDAYLLACTALEVSQSTANQSSVQLAVIDKVKKEIASNQNNNVQANEVHEANIKTVNAIAIKYKINAALSEDDKITLYDIAVQCPFNGGVGVYQSRAILSHFYDDMGYNDEATCMLDGYSMRTINTNNSAISFSFDIVPNPAKDYFEIKAEGIDVKGKLLTILDAYGHVVKSQILSNENTNRIKTNGLTNGIYFVAIANGSVQQFQKLVIVK